LTLNDNTTTTTVGNHSVTSNSIILLSPTSANAAASGAFVSGKVAGTSFTVTHDNTSATDKTFNFWLVN
jgi:hypothetical protein